LSDAEKGIIRVLKRDIQFYQKVPPDLREELQKAITEAAIPWREAREKSEFQIFRPHLEKITELKRKQAEHLDPSTHPYNALLDLSEESLTTSDLDKIFGELIPELKRILAKTLAEGAFPEKHPREYTSPNRVSGRILWEGADSSSPCPIRSSSGVSASYHSTRRTRSTTTSTA